MPMWSILTGLAIFPMLLLAEEIIVLSGEKFEIACDESQEHTTKGIEIRKGNQTIYRSSHPNDSSFNWYKYEINAPSSPDMLHRLTVKKADFDDAYVYKCVGVSSKRVISSTTVIVTNIPKILSDGTHIEDEDLITRCRVDFMYSGLKPCKSNDNEHCPSLSILYQGQFVNDTTYDCDPVHSMGSMMCSAQAVFPHKPTRHEDGLLRKCTLSFRDFKKSVSAPLIVKYPVSKPLMSPTQKQYHVGEYITCVAVGNPHPLYKWVSLLDDQKIDCKKLHLTINMTGINSWKCLVENEPGTVPIVKESKLVFKVVQMSHHQGHWNPLSIGLIAVVLPLSVLLSVLVAVIIFKRRHKLSHSAPHNLSTQEDILLTPREESPI